MKSMVTKYTEYCIFCGKPRQAEHHLIGGGKKPKADKDGLTIPVCNDCHNMGKLIERIHGNIMAEKMSKMMGQLTWEKHAVAGGMSEDEARVAFRLRYGKSYL